jgi:hypothetical protein
MSLDGPESALDDVSEAEEEAVPSLFTGRERLSMPPRENISARATRPIAAIPTAIAKIVTLVSP